MVKLVLLVFSVLPMFLVLLFPFLNLTFFMVSFFFFFSSFVISSLSFVVLVRIIKRENRTEQNGTEQRHGIIGAVPVSRW